MSVVIAVVKLTLALIETTRVGKSVTKMHGYAATTLFGPEVAGFPVSPAKPKAAPPICPNSVSGIPVNAPVVSTTSISALERSAR
jgi:hypothetical protein